MSKKLFINNRRQVVDKLGVDVLVLTAYDKVQQTNDGAAPFVQESNFWWLTGIEQPGWKLLIDNKSGEVALVAPQLSDIEKVFDSYLTPEQARAISGIDNFITDNELWQRVAGRTVYTLEPIPRGAYSFALNPAPGKLHKKLTSRAQAVKNARPVLAKLRAIKQPEELAMMQQAIDLTIEAFNHAKQRLQQYSTEAELAAEFTYRFMKQEAKHAYEPIVASDKNACTLHYTANNAPLHNGYILLDIGAKFGGYNADITRTYGFGTLTQRQKDIHAAVRQAEAEIIALLKPGLRVKDYILQVDEIMQKHLITLGLMKNKDDKDNYRKYFPHSVSHGLGVDVHDSLGAPEEFQPGMVLTVEPGIYIPEERIGVRIEDDILITKNGHKNLSAKLSTES